MKKLNSLLLLLVMAFSAIQAQAATFVGDRTDFRDETIYFAMTTRFYDGDPQNNVCTWDKQQQQIDDKDPAWRGDFAGLIKKLDYIKALGFTAIWITPVVQNASGIDYHGYHAMDLSKVDLRYESRTEWGCEEDVDFQDLIDAAHAKGMKIVLDVVLQHTGNFGEAKLNPLFTRNQNIRNQASIEACMMPDNDRLGGADYWKLNPDTEQYPARWKYFKNPQYEPNNYYHHYGTGWNWDLPNRWWGQIAGDCVDLNTENDAVAEYVVDCYGTFIEMGVDAFRIDTSGHIAPLTFNEQFIPQFHEIANRPEVKAKRLNGIDFYMFGEVCQRFQGSVVYRNQPNLSSYYYTWKSDQSLHNKYKETSSPEWWKQQNLPEGHDTPVGPMAVCESETADRARSNNAWMQNGQWHEPDYSQSSGFNVIDFPVHYSFSSVGNVFGLFSQDNYYNDATFNVVYVDSHDYGPGPNDGTRFNGGTSQWAENLSFMFTFRGIPCIYYGSEVEFMKGAKIDDGMQTKLSMTGRAYFGHYLEGDVKATDFAQFTASGQVAQTLNGDLAHHIQQLNKIRAAVPALRKGQYTFDGCSANGGWAFKRAYKDSYALVAVNGGATFSNVPAGTYTDIVTGKTYNGGGSITVDAPRSQGQLRVLVKGWTGGKVVDEGKFIYSSSPVSKGGSPSATDPGASFFYTKNDAVDESVGMSFSPNGGSFKTETLTVTATLTAGATSGTFKVGNGAQQTITQGQSKTFTVGQGMNFNETVTVTWTATGKEGNANGSVTYKKVDPNAVITVYCKAPSAPNLYAWTTGTSTTELNGGWPGTKMSQTATINGQTFYYVDFPGVDNFNIIFNNGSGAQTGNITGITETVYYEYDGGSTAKLLDIDAPVQPKKPTVTASPASGTNFNESITVTLSVNPSVAIHYTTDGSTPSASSATYSSALTFTETTTLKTFVENEAGSNVQTFIYTKTDTPIQPTGEHYIYFDGTSFSQPQVWAWNDTENCTTATAWPGDNMTKKDGKWYWEVPSGKSVPTGLIIHEGDNKIGGGDLVYVDKATYHQDGSYTAGNNPNPNPNPDPTPSNDWVAYWDNSSTNWGTVYAYAWHDNGEVFGTWPGIQINSVTVDGKTYYKATITGAGSMSNPKIIFNNGNGTQTGDFILENNAVYNMGGKTGQVSGISNIFNNPALRVYTSQGNIFIIAQEEAIVTIVSADGRMIQREVFPGVNTIDGLPRGFYIVNQTKVIL